MRGPPAFRCSMSTHSNSSAPIDLADEDIATCVRVLRAIDLDRSHLIRLTQERRRELLTLAGHVAKPEKHGLVRQAKAFRRADRAAAKARDRSTLDRTALRVQRQSEVYRPLWLERPSDVAPERPTLLNERTCYVC